MTNIYNTGNPLGSTDPRDLLDNASNLDDGMNSALPTFNDRLGVSRDTWAGQENSFNTAQAGRSAQFDAAQSAWDSQFTAFLESSGFVSLGNYAPGVTFTEYNQYTAYEGFFWRPSPSSLPFTTSGTWIGADENLFVLFSQDDVLRQDLADATDPAKGAGLVGLKKIGAGATATTVLSALEPINSIKNYGLAGQLVTPEDTSAARAVLNLQHNMYRDKSNYHLPDMGLKVWKGTYGNKDTAAVLSIASAGTGEHTTNVVGWATDAGVSSYPDRDHVGIFGKTDGQPALVSTSNTVFASTSVQSADFAALISSGSIRAGMLIDTNESPKKTGTINGVDAGTNTISVSAWYIVDGSGLTGTPANGVTVHVNPSTKIWGLNWNVGLSPDSMATDGFGFELGTFNTKADGMLSGYYAVNLGTKKGRSAFWAKGAGSNYQTGLTLDGCDIGSFISGNVISGIVSNASLVSFKSQGAPTALDVRDASGVTSYTSIDGNGRVKRRLSTIQNLAANSTIDASAVVAVGAVITAATTYNLPAASTQNIGREIYLKNPLASTANAFFAGAVEAGGGSISVTPGSSVLVVYDGSVWIPIARYLAT